MSKKMKFKLNRRGVRELLRSEEMGAVVDEHARATAAAAGEGYEVIEGMWPSRQMATVFAETPEARKDNYDNNTLLKSLR